MVTIVNYGVGNLLAIQNIIKKVGGKSIVTGNAQEIRNATKLILPGVGDFKYCAQQLELQDLKPALEDAVLVKKKPILGLCVGAQLMTRHSEEGNANGLGWVNAKTVRFDINRVKIIPHMGWADVKFKQSGLTQNLDMTPRFYFVHSYHFVFDDETQVLGSAHYGYDFACAFHHSNIYGVQFHPEKSHRFGMKLFENFINL